MTLTYEEALTSFRNAVNQVHPPEIKNTNGRMAHRRHIRETHRGRGRSNRGRGGGRGRGEVKRSRTDSSIITLTDGQRVEYHASFNFPRHVFEKMKQEDKDRLKRERAAYKEAKRMKTRIQELETSVSSQGGGIASVTPTREIKVASTENDNSSLVSDVSRTTMMGGRNERQMQRRA